MNRLFFGHDIPNWAFIAMTLLAALLGEGFTALIDKYERANQVWCGCDGEGMAHLPGAKGFDCEEKP